MLEMIFSASLFTVNQSLD